MEPDAIIDVRFKTPEENGRQTAVTDDYYSCPFIVDGEAFDCRLLLSGHHLELGKTYQVPVKFMNWPLVRPRLSEGKSFILWEGKDVATGKVVCLEATQLCVECALMAENQEGELSARGTAVAQLPSRTG